jgi:hypothetical protein
MSMMVFRAPDQEQEQEAGAESLVNYELTFLICHLGDNDERDPIDNC